MWELNRADSVEIVKTSPVRVVLRVKKSFLGLAKSRYSPTEDFPSSFFTQYITLYRDLDRIDIKTEADWWESHMFLKAAFPLSITNDYASYEIPFAAIRRTTKFETLWEKARFEVPALKWADLSEKKYGFSLLNDCKYGYDIHGNVMKISLLRAPTWPDPMADRGKHTFTYSIYVHQGMWHEAETVKRGYQLNSPLAAVITDRHQGEFPGVSSFFSVNSPGVILDSIKKVEKGTGFIFRFYESMGRAESAVMNFFKAPKRIFETDLMENDLKEIQFTANRVSLDFKKFEIKTLKVLFR
jgi:alpha-mannosidase